MWQSSAALLFVVVLSTAPAVSLAVTTDHPEDVVQVLVGTDTRSGDDNSNGNTLPQIKMPWGFNDWAPQTDGDNGAWWFHRRDTTFQGMRCTHQPSPWIGDYGHFLLKPHVEGGGSDLSWSEAGSDFKPYLFNTTLEGIGFEFAPTSHAAIVRMNFPKSAKNAYLSASLGNSDYNGKVTLMDYGRNIKGHTRNNAGGVPNNWHGTYFSVKVLSATVQSSNTAETSDSDTATFHFANTGEPVVVAVATSFISHKQAELNLQQEIGSKTFEDVLSEGRARWAEELGRIKVDATDDTALSVFYTNLWKGMLFPRYLQEVDANGQEVHRSPYTGKVNKGKIVADSGFWDSYRTVYQLQSLVFPDNLGSLIDGWVDASQEANWLPEWPSPGQHASMVGTMGDVTLADAIAKSKWGFLSGFDVNKAYDAIRKDAYSDPEGLFGRQGLRSYIDRGYVADDVSESVSRTLNYYLSDAAIARAAALLGKDEDEKELRERSQRYPVIFDKSTGFFRPKNDAGEFTDDFDPLSWGNGFTEAGAWQYRFYLPYDVEGLQKLYDGKLCDTIESMMLQTTGESYRVGSYGNDIHEMRELAAVHREFGLYAHGNQPVHHVLYVAKKAGCNSIADKYLRKVMDKLYTLRGWAGDEDNGEMASWYVLSALGVYSLEGAKDEIVLGSPAVNHATLKLPNNKVLAVAAENQASDNVYVQSVTWTPEGGSPRTIKDNVMKFTEIMNGGKLSFSMGSSPKPAPQLRAAKPHLRDGMR